MRVELKQAFESELGLARAEKAKNNFEGAFHHLERAHILSQRFALAHASVHLRMLHLGWVCGDWREVVGQVNRSLAALVFSRVWVPLGNTGRSNVSAFQPMPVPADLLRYLQ